MTRERRLALALGLNVVLVALQVGFGIAARSLGLLADAGHNLTDVAAVGLALFAVRLAARPANARRSFGYHRSTILAAQANAAAILVVTVLVTYEGIRRLLDPPKVHAGLVIVVAAIATAINVGAALALDDDSHDLNMHGALLHMLSDAATSAGVVVAAVIIATTGGNDWLDPAVSIVIGLVIAWRAVQLLRATTGVLLESTPAHLDLAALASAMAAVPGVEAIHDLHAWSLSSEVHAMSAHVMVQGEPSLLEVQAICARVKAAVGEEFGIAHVTLEAEVEHCAPGRPGDCVMDTDPPAHASHTPHHH